jgi:hypothetical protein
MPFPANVPGKVQHDGSPNLVTYDLREGIPEQT